MDTWQKWECMAQIKHVVYWCLTWKLTFTSPSRFAEKRRKLAFSQIFSAVKNRNVLFGEMYTKGMDSLCVSDRWFHSGELGNRPQQSDGFLNSLPISQFHWSLFPWACTVHLVTVSVRLTEARVASYSPPLVWYGHLTNSTPVSEHFDQPITL